MAGDAALEVEHIFLRIDSCRNVDHHQFSCVSTEFRRVLTHRQGMQIHHSIEALIFIGQVYPVLQGAQIVAQCQITGCLHAAVEYLAFFIHVCFSPL